MLLPTRMLRDDKTYQNDATLLRKISLKSKNQEFSEGVSSVELQHHRITYRNPGENSSKKKGH